MPIGGSASNFPNGFAYGLVVRGIPLLQAQPGQVFYVGNSPVLNSIQSKAGSDSNRGTYLAPFATLNFALTATLPGRGDIIFILPNHQENISNATATILTGADVAIIGLGSGTSRPTFIWDTATTANIPVRGANLSIQNCLFIANFADVASMFTLQNASVTASVAAGTAASSVAGVGGIMTVTVVGSGTIYVGQAVSGTGVPPGTLIISQISGTAGGVGTYQLDNSFTFASGTLVTGCPDFCIDQCEVRDTSSILNALTVVTTSATANACDGLTVSRSRISSLGTTAATTAIKLLAVCNRVKVMSNWGTWAVLNNTAAMLACSTFNHLDMEFGLNVLNKPNTSSTGGSFVSGSGTCTGHFHDNYCWQLVAAAGIWAPTTMGIAFSQNFSPITGAADKSGLINPAAV